MSTETDAVSKVVGENVDKTSELPPASESVTEQQGTSRAKVRELAAVADAGADTAQVSQTGGNDTAARITPTPPHEVSVPVDKHSEEKPAGQNQDDTPNGEDVEVRNNSKFGLISFTLTSHSDLLPVKL